MCDIQEEILGSKKKKKENKDTNYCLVNLPIKDVGPVDLDNVTFISWSKTFP